MRNNNISISGLVAEVLPPKEIITRRGEKIIRQQILLQRPNGKHPFKMALSLYGTDVDTVSVGSYIKCLYANDVNLTPQGNWVNNLNIYKLIKL